MGTKNPFAASVAALSATLIAPVFAQGTNTPKPDRRQKHDAQKTPVPAPAN